MSPWNPALTPTLIGSGGAAIVGKTECGMEPEWSRRSEESLSAGLLICHKSSLIEISGNSTATSTMRVTNDRGRSPLAPLPKHNQRHMTATDTAAQAELRNNSILRVHYILARHEVECHKMSRFDTLSTHPPVTNALAPISSPFRRCTRDQPLLLDFGE